MLTALNDPSSLPPNTQGFLTQVPDSAAERIKAQHSISQAWDCLGASHDLCQLAFFAENRNGSADSHYVGLCEAPADHLYCLFASPRRFAYTMVVVSVSSLHVSPSERPPEPE